MKKITEHKIEQFLRFSYELSEQEKTEIRQALQYSEEVQRMYTFLKDYYDELDRVSGAQSFIIPLSVKKTNPFSGPVVLAAMTKETHATSLITKATLVSEEHKTLVRVLENRSDHTLQFHVIGEQPKQNERAILSLLGPKLDLVTDKQGKLKNVRELSDIHWDEVSTLLRVPVYKTEINTPETTFTLKAISGTNIGVKKTNQELEITIKNHSTDLTRVLMVQGSEAELRRIETPSVQFQLSGDSAVQLFFYK